MYVLATDDPDVRAWLAVSRAAAESVRRVLEAIGADILEAEAAQDEARVSELEAAREAVRDIIRVGVE